MLKRVTISIKQPIHIHIHVHTYVHLKSETELTDRLSTLHISSHPQKKLKDTKALNAMQ